MPGVLKLEGTNIATGDGNGAVTLGSTVTVPSTASACVKLYRADISGVSLVSIDGYFNDSIYQYYTLRLDALRQDIDANNQLFFRVNVGGSADSTSMYWNCANGNFNDNGGANSMTRADNDGNNKSHMDNTWYVADAGQAAGSGTYVMSIAEPQQTDRYCSVYWVHTATRSGSSSSFRAIMGHHMCTIDSSNKVITGFSFFTGNSTNLSLQATLYGFKK